MSAPRERGHQETKKWLQVENIPEAIASKATGDSILEEIENAQRHLETCKPEQKQFWRNHLDFLRGIAKALD